MLVLNYAKSPRACPWHKIQPQTQIVAKDIEQMKKIIPIKGQIADIRSFVELKGGNYSLKEGVVYKEK